MALISCSTAIVGFNLAIEFGPVHASACPLPNRPAPSFQSRNRVWAGSRQIAALNAAIAALFQSRNRVWAGSRLDARPRVIQPLHSFNLAIEFGPVHAVMAGQ